MADIKRQNELIRLAINGHRDECRNDAERQFYDETLLDMKIAERLGAGLDLVHEVDYPE